MTAVENAVGGAVVELPGLGEMLAAIDRDPEVFKPSRFWEHHNSSNLEQISEDGFHAFKRTVNTNYFQWEPGSPRGDGPRELVARQLLRVWSRRPDPRVFRARLAYPQRSLHASTAPRWHAIFVAMLWEHARRHDRLDLLDKLQEPELGEPPSVRHRGRLVSEDLAHSAMELSTIDEAGGLPASGSLVVELGGGYGRLAWLLLTAQPGVRYVACDIPPALAIAQRYLTELFPARSVFRFRDIRDPAAILDGVANADLAFLLPSQLAMLPSLQADLFINISSLHEMRRDQIARWFELIDRHTAGRFYTKQWIRSVNIFDDVVIDRNDYPVPEHWQVLLDRDVEVPPDFFEAVYRVGAPPGRRE